MTYRFVDCNGLAGGGTLGFALMGFHLLHRCGTLSLGHQAPRANRPILGWEWEDEFSDDPEDWWAPNDVDVVYGNPPCAGYSTLSRADFRGMNSPANVHMNMLVKYMGRVKPTIGVFESVQQAYTTGREHMRLLRDKLEADTGCRYSLYHVKHNNSSLGGASNRKRYFWVVSRVPFGMDPPVPHRAPILMEAIGDLQGLANTWERQPYRRPETWWSSRRRNECGTVDGHAARRLTHARRMGDLIDAADGDWPQGWRTEDVARKIYQRNGTLPDSWKPVEERLVASDFNMGFNQPVRWRGDIPARVLTGGALDQAVHPTEPRLFTLREAMRIQGYPDNWRLWPLRDVATHPLFPGKGVPVDAGRWIAYWVRRALDGNPGSMRGVPDGDREFLFDSTYNYRLAPPMLGRRVLH